MNSAKTGPLSGFIVWMIACGLQCLDGSGEVVMEDPVGYAFLWTGIFAGVGIILSGGLAFALAAPAGVLITRLLNRNKRT